MMTERLALDFDSTLANIHPPAFELICGPDHGYTAEEVEDWEWGFREFGKIKYLSALWNVWTLRPEDIEAYEDDVAEQVDALRELFTVDIVTAHPDHLGIDEGKQDWLDRHGISYNEFVVVPTNKDKTEMNYDVFIDDKPSLPKKASEDQRVYVYDQPHNQHAEGDYIRVNSLAEVVDRETLKIPSPKDLSTLE